MDEGEIEGLIPHREPFLWIDEVLDLSDRSIRAAKSLDPRLDVFAGHYPGFPVLPGVLLCEAAFQAGAVLIAKSQPHRDDRVPVVTRLNNVKFRRIVRPGETLEIRVELTDQLGSAFYLKARVTVGNEIACTLDFACAMAPRE